MVSDGGDYQAMALFPLFSWATRDGSSHCEKRVAVDMWDHLAEAATAIGLAVFGVRAVELFTSPLIGRHPRGAEKDSSADEVAFGDYLGRRRIVSP